MAYARFLTIFAPVQPNYVNQASLAAFIEAALKEDVGDGDHTTLASIPENLEDSAELIIKDDGLIAGLEMAQHIFNAVNPDLDVQMLLEDGDEIRPLDVGFIVTGQVRSILTAERLVLNCLQRMSGIATYTDYLNSLIEGTNAKLLDTRKTTPNFRMAEKWAVAIGGGTNHRFGLFDMILLKDNHIDYAGGIKQAIAAAHRYLAETGKELPIEVETRTLNEVSDALDTNGVDYIMLDNMSLDHMKEAVDLIGNRCKVEASGGITEETIRPIAECGVDFISVGALTHSATSLDMSLKAVR